MTLTGELFRLIIFFTFLTPSWLLSVVRSNPYSVRQTVLSLLDAAKRCQRGQLSGASRNNAQYLISELEDSAFGKSFGLREIEGEWELCFATDDVTRSSPFFWAFRKSLEGVKDTSPIKLKGTGEIVDSIFFITDSVPEPLKVIGNARQTIRLDYASISRGSLTSRIEVISVGSSSSVMTTTARISSPAEAMAETIQQKSVEIDDRSTPAAHRNVFELEVQTTEVVTTNPVLQFIKNIVAPGFRGLGLVDVASAMDKFPSGRVLEAVRAGSSSVSMRLTYLDDHIRIVRPENGLTGEESIVFVYKRV